LLGTTYGGNGQTTFGLPNLQGRTPIHMGSGHTLGEQAGEQAHTLSIAELPTHTHTLNGSTNTATTVTPDTTPCCHFRHRNSAMALSMRGTWRPSRRTRSPTWVAARRT